MKGKRLVDSIPVEVKFSIEIRPATSTQLEAGKRLFERLVARAKSSIQTSNESKQVEKKK